MSILPYYDLETADYGSTGWNSIFSSNFQKIDDALHTISGTASGTGGDLDTHKTSSDHDTRYYTEDEVDNLFATTVSGWSGSIPTVSGTITVANGLITDYTAF